MAPGGGLEIFSQGPEVIAQVITLLSGCVLSTLERHARTHELKSFSRLSSIPPGIKRIFYCTYNEWSYLPTRHGDLNLKV